MKRFLSLFLVLCTLLCLFPVAASASEGTLAGSGTATMKPEGPLTAITYLDLYVKDGLVALFDGYSAQASEEAITSLVPADLYGKEGYDAYLNPETYTANFGFVGEGWTWQYVDGGIKAVKGDVSSTWSNYTYLDLSSLGALLGTTYSVQEVFTIANATPVVEDGVLTNASDIKEVGRSSANYLGEFYYGITLAGRTTAAANGVHNGYNIAFDQLGFPGKYLGHFYFINPEYGVTKYAALTDTDGNDLAGNYVGSGAITVERTVYRLGYTASDPYEKEVELKDEEGNVTGTEMQTFIDYTSTYGTYFAIKPEHRSSNPTWYAANRDIPCTSTNEADHTSTKLNVMADHGTYYSVRVYNKALSVAEYNQNHFADLVAFYDIDPATVSRVLAMDPAVQAAVYAGLSAVQLPMGGYADAAYEDGKVEVLNAIEATLKKFEDQFEILKAVDLYEKEGLVALFFEHHLIASGNALTKLTPVDLYTQEGYEDYIDPSSYSANLVGSWTEIDGAIRPSSKTDYLDLNELGALLDTSYTVQEITAYNFTKPTVNEDGTLDTTGAAAFGNYDNTAVGSFCYGTLSGALRTAGGIGMTACTPPVHLAYGFHEQYQWGAPGGAASYIMIDAFATEDYNVTYYENATLSGTTGLYVAGPTAIERTTIRLGVTDDGAGSYTSQYKVHFAFANNQRTGDSFYLANERTFTKTTAEADTHNSTTLRLVGQQADVYSIRVYDDELSASGIARNHMADLVAYYGISVDAVKELSPLELAIFIDNAQSVRLAHGGKGTDDYAAQKAALEALLENEEAAVMVEYLDMYVKDGLVALFDGHSVKASATPVTTWAPINFYGVEGYDDYINPASYAVSFQTGGNRVELVPANGGYQANLLHKNSNVWNSNAGLVLSELGALLGTTYSVQEVFSYVNYIPVVEDGVITNYADLYPVSNYGGGWTMGALQGGTSQAIGVPGTATELLDGVNHLYMVPVDQLTFNGDYKGHWTYMTNGAATLYESLTAIDAEGNPVVDAESAEVVFENYYVGGTSTWERTIIRLGYTATEREAEIIDEATGEATGTQMVTDYTSTYKNVFNVAPWGRSGSSNWKLPNTTMSFTTTDLEDPHKSTDLVIANNGLTRAIRVYNRELTEAEIYQNHVADLVAVYAEDTGIIYNIKNLPDSVFAEFAAEAYAIEIGETDAEWAEYKADFEELVEKYENYGIYLVDKALTFEGFLCRATGDHGLRAIFSVDKEAIAKLNAFGYDVVYGAVVATADGDLPTVSVDEDGKVVASRGMAIASNDPAFKHLTEDNASFAVTTIYNEEGHYATELTYLGFVIVFEGEHAMPFYKACTLGEDRAISLDEVYNHMLTTIADLPAEIKARIEAILNR